MIAGAEAVAAFDLARLDRAFLDDPYPDLSRAARARPGAPHAGRLVFPHPLRRSGRGLSRRRRPGARTRRSQFKPNFGDSPLYEHHTTSLVFNDPPIHTRVRKLLAPAFTPRALARAAAAHRGAGRPAARSPRPSAARIDLIEDFAAAIPVQLIGDLLGIPQDERGPLRDWSLAILGALEPVLSPEQFDARRHARSPSSRTICAIWSRRERGRRAATAAKSSRR